MFLNWAGNGSSFNVNFNNAAHQLKYKSPQYDNQHRLIFTDIIRGLWCRFRPRLSPPPTCSAALISMDYLPPSGSGSSQLDHAHVSCEKASNKHIYANTPMGRWGRCCKIGQLLQLSSGTSMPNIIHNITENNCRTNYHMVLNRYNINAVQKRNNTTRLFLLEIPDTYSIPILRWILPRIPAHSFSFDFLLILLLPKFISLCNFKRHLPRSRTLFIKLLFNHQLMS